MPRLLWVGHNNRIYIAPYGRAQQTLVFLVIITVIMVMMMMMMLMMIVLLTRKASLPVDIAVWNEGFASPVVKYPGRTAFMGTSH